LIIILATAFGLAACVQSLALCVCPLAFGYIVDSTISWKHSRYGYKWAIIFVFVLAALGVLAGILLEIYDIKN